MKARNKERSMEKIRNLYEKKCSQCEYFVQEDYESDWCCYSGDRFDDGEPEVCDEFVLKEEV